MKNASQLFKELGYKLIKDDSEELIYEYKYYAYGKKEFISTITFNKESRYIINEGTLFKHLLEAINQQIKELNW